ncbi:GIY-YIG nuclease family protein [Salinivirga cyanobacteriivorans]
MAYVYIIYSQVLDKYYVGHTTSLPEERLKKHLQKHKGFTSTAKDWEIVYTESFPDKLEAFARERQIKGWKSKVKIRELIEKGA